MQLSINVKEFIGINSSTSKYILNVLETIYLSIYKFDCVLL